MIVPISRKEFDALGPIRRPMPGGLTQEVAWYRNTDNTRIGTVFLDKTDNDWAWVIQGKHSDGFRCVDVNSCLPSQEAATEELKAAMEKRDKEGVSPQS